MTTQTVLAIPANFLPSVFTAQLQARKRLRDFFGSHIRNPNTRRAYMEAVRQFSTFWHSTASSISLRSSRPTSRPLSCRTNKSLLFTIHFAEQVVCSEA
jgi:hypothetical protein